MNLPNLLLKKVSQEFIIRNWNITDIALIVLLDYLFDL
jgi:hypothetical protein